jgi:hypothetical protein
LLIQNPSQLKICTTWSRTDPRPKPGSSRT